MTNRLVFSTHALERMFERKISNIHVRHVLETGIVIKEYPDDTPCPSRLILGWWETRPLHIVVAYNMQDQKSIIITVYEPDPNEWEPDFRRKRL